MNKQMLMRSMSSAVNGAAFMNVSQIADWTGRSRDFVRNYITRDLECMAGKGQAKMFLIDDIATRIMAISEVS